MKYRELVNQFHGGRRDFSLEELRTSSTIKGRENTTLAVYMLVSGYMFPLDHPVLFEIQPSGYSIAHYMAQMGCAFPEDHPSLKITTREGLSVYRIVQLKKGK